MKKSELFKIIEPLGFHPGKMLGQNFLIDDNMLDFIVRSANPQKNELVLEVGPGFGALTKRLIDFGSKVTAIEFDHRICDYLRKTFTTDNFTLIEGDVCKVNLEEILQGCEFRSIANLPYAVSSPFLGILLQLSKPPKEMIFMLQKETAERIAASPSSKAYSALSVRTQLIYDVKILRKVPPQVFYPQPKVESAIVQFVRKSQIPEIEFRKELELFTKLAFSQRRKKMIKALQTIYPKDILLDAFKSLNLKEDIRAEKLSVKQFIDLLKLSISSVYSDKAEVKETQI